MRTLASPVLLLTLALGSVPGIVRGDQAEILQLRESYMRFQEAGDADGCVSYWDEDGTILPPGEPAVQGKKALRNWYQNVFDQVTLNNDLRYGDIEVYGDWSFATGTYSGTTTLRGSGDVIEDSGKFLEIHKRQPDGSWKFYRHMWSSDQ